MQHTLQWKTITGYENLYSVSSDGNVLSHNKYGILTKKKNKSGYFYVQLFNNTKMKSYLIHRLVATEFIPNPLNLPEINHKVGVKTNNYVDNLEWIDRKGNIEHAVEKGLINSVSLKGNQNASKRIRVFKIRNGHIIGEFDSITIASKVLQINRCNISDVLRGRYQMTHGLGFTYI